MSGQGGDEKKNKSKLTIDRCQLLVDVCGTQTRGDDITNYYQYFTTRINLERCIRERWTYQTIVIIPPTIQSTHSC
jgi:hypothetical protein